MNKTLNIAVLAAAILSSPTQLLNSLRKADIIEDDETLNYLKDVHVSGKSRREAADKNFPGKTNSLVTLNRKLGNVGENLLNALFNAPADVTEAATPGITAEDIKTLSIDQLVAIQRGELSIEAAIAGKAPKVAVAASATATTGEGKKRGPKPGGKRRPQEEIDRKKLEKALAVKGRAALNLSARGRLDAERQAKLEKWTSTQTHINTVAKEIGVSPTLVTG